MAHMVKQKDEEAEAEPEGEEEKKEKERCWEQSKRREEEVQVLVLVFRACKLIKRGPFCARTRMTIELWKSRSYNYLIKWTEVMRIDNYIKEYISY